MDPRWAAELVDKQLLIDGRNVLNIDAWRRTGWVIRALGRAESALPSVLWDSLVHLLLMVTPANENRHHLLTFNHYSV